MPLTAPLFILTQGNPSPTIDYVSTLRNQVLRGTLDPATVDVQVNLNGTGFTSDPNLVEFDQNTFVIPNRNVYPEGLRLPFGVNSISVRTIGPTGAASPVSTATLRILRPSEVNLTAPAPTGIRVRRKRNSVELLWSDTDVPNVRGYNVYASSEPSGGLSGYVKINRDLISVPAFQEEELIPVAADVTSYTSNFGQLRVLLIEEDFNQDPIQTVKDGVLDTALAGPDVRVTTSVESVRTRTFYHFIHDRDGTEAEGFINNEVFADIPTDDPLYYVMTTVVLDPSSGQEVESAYSAELVGSPLIIDTQLRDLPRRTRFDVSEDYIAKILNYDNEISVIPGSVVKDIFIDPFSTEAERLYFIADFIRRSQSFSTLMVVDELQSYKQALASALGFTSLNDVQEILDDSFDKLAANANVTRQGAQVAVGEVVFFTSSEPVTDLVVEEGTLVLPETGGPTFRVTARVTLPYAQRQSFYNLQRRRWEITASVRATSPGEAGNLPAGKLTRSVGGSSGMLVTNLSATRFGRDEESNQDLAERAILAFSSVDVGTAHGYLSTAIGEVGVFRADIVDAGHPLMMRDYDDIRKKHLKGKVDIWIQGTDEISVQDTFALQFGVERNVRFILDSIPADYIFIVDDPRITPENPIVQLLGELPSEQAQGFGFRNITTGDTYDLTGYTLLSHNRIQLNTGIPQPQVRPNDLLAGDFRFRRTNQYVFSRQPSLQVDSVRSLNTGDVLEAGVNFQLYRLEDPLLEGFSTQAQDYLQVMEANNIPSGQTFVVNDERRVLVGEIPEPLTNLGVTPFTVRVFSLDRLTEYEGPDGINPDFFIEPGTDTTPLHIIRNPQGAIGNGQEVSVDYEHDENFQVSYVINNTLLEVQRKVDKQRHITADVLVKNAIPNPLDIEMTVVLSPGANRSKVDLDVRTNVSQLLNSSGVGKAVHQSDVVHAVEKTPGVHYVVVPFARMTHSEGNFIVREVINNASVILEQGPNNKVCVLQEALRYSTIDGGGDGFSHKGVFQDTQPLTFVNSYAALRTTVNSAYVVGNDGLIIQGYTDDATLTNQGFTTTATRVARRRALTANHVFVSLPQNDSTQNHTYAVSYRVGKDQGSNSTIELSAVAYAELGNLTITYRG
jgi:uncharacterized phage protein gp47/JayE